VGRGPGRGPAVRRRTAGHQVRARLGRTRRQRVYGQRAQGDRRRAPAQRGDRGADDGALFGDGDPTEILYRGRPYRVQREDGRFLLGQRPAGKVYAGYWEFPGGKVEDGESPPAALSRELHEELGIEVSTAYPWIIREFDYPHAAVRLHFFRVRGWRGEPHGREAQAVAWQRLDAIDVAPLLPSNCGFDIGWSEHFANRHAGAPLKPVIAHWRDDAGVEHALQGECVATATGIEGSLVYALSATLRDAIAREGQATLHLDLAPGRDLDRLRRDLAKSRAGRSISEHLRRQAGLLGAKASLLHEVLEKPQLQDAGTLARTIKRLPLVLRRARPLAEAISSAGGVRLEAMDASLMLDAVPGTFCAGEMLDWEAPTGGYLLTACFASGRRAGLAAAAWLASGRIEAGPIEATPGVSP